MKVLSESLGVARSQLTIRFKQPSPGSQPRRRRTLNDEALVEQIKQAVGALPSYGYPCGLQRSEETLHRRIVQTVSPPRVAGHDAMPLKQGLVVVGAILTAAIRLQQHFRFWLSASNSHL